MLLDGVTINDGKDSLAGVCATPICVDRRIAGIAVEAIRLVAIMVDKKLRAERYRVAMKTISRRDEGADDGCPASSKARMAEFRRDSARRS